MPDRQFVFAPFRLDLVNEQLWQDEELVSLRPKLFALLRYLVEHAHERAVLLCQHIGNTPQLFPVLAGLWGFRFLRAELLTANELAAQLFRLAQSTSDPALLLWAHTVQGLTLSTLGELPAALRHLEEGIALYDPQLHQPDRTRVGAQDPKMMCLSYAAWTLWRLGYPDQARKKVAEALAWAQELAHPFSLAFALDFAGAGVNMFLREVTVVHTYTEMLMRLSQEQGFPYWSAWGTVRQGWVLAEQGQFAAGIAKMRQGMDAVQLTGAALSMSYILAQLADAYGKVGQGEEGLPLLAEALAQVTQTGERWYEAELHRLKGQLALQSHVQNLKSKVPSPQHPIPNTQAEAEACFHKALEVAQQQSARSLELRAAMSLARLWQQQGKKREAHQLLSDIYGWFTEGFDTVGLTEAKALLKALS